MSVRCLKALRDGGGADGVAAALARAVGGGGDRAAFAVSVRARGGGG